MTTVQKDQMVNTKENQPHQKCQKKNKKVFVYNPDKDASLKQTENKKEETQKEEIQIQQQEIKVEPQTNSKKNNNKNKKNKKQFVYNPQNDQKKQENEEIENQKVKENENQKNVVETSPVEKEDEQIKIETNNQQNENKNNNNNKSSKKKNKMKFVYNPDQEARSNKSNEIKEENTTTLPAQNNNNNCTNNNKNNNNHKNNNNNKNNHKNNNFKNNNNNHNNFKNNNAKLNNEFNKKNNRNNEKDNDSVNYTTYIELDMHGYDPRAKTPLQWVPVIRDALFSALEKNVDVVRFIPGKGLHSNPEIGPILRVLVLLTSKRLGFESNVNPDNEGVIICKISNRSKTSAIVPHIPNKNDQEDLNRNDTLLKAFGMKTGDNLNIDNLSFRAVKSRFPHMPTICIGIICVKRTPKEALEFAQSFEDSLISDNEIEISNNNANKELLAEMKIIEALEEKYNFNQEIIERVVREKRKEKKSQIILDRISSEIPNNFLNYLTEFLLNFSHVPIETLLDSMKEGLYNPTEITQILNSKSWKGMNNALSVMKVENQITTDRNDGRPKFIPTIEIDLSNANSQKALVTLDKIMNGLGNGNFSEMVLLLAPKNQKSNKCTLNDINMFLYNKASQEGFHIVRTRKTDEKNNKFHFTIFNCKDEF